MWEVSLLELLNLTFVFHPWNKNTIAQQADDFESRFRIIPHYDNGRLQVQTGRIRRWHLWRNNNLLLVQHESNSFVMPNRALNSDRNQLIAKKRKLRNMSKKKRKMIKICKRALSTSEQSLILGLPVCEPTESCNFCVPLFHEEYVQASHSPALSLLI